MPNDMLVRAADATLASIALNGLSRRQKTLPAKLFYDEEGCRLFYRITRLPEYYLTRTELALLRDISPDIAAVIGPGAVLVEYGASDATKADILLGQSDRVGRQAFSTYIPIDVAATALARMTDDLRRRRPELSVMPIIADFVDFVSLPSILQRHSLLGFFPGSTIGNLDPEEACSFLVQARRTLGAGARMLVGVDLRKDPSILIPAYDDAEGVTAAFNRNVLVRLNREAGADFAVSEFAHRALWNDAKSRIEMHLESRRDQVVRIAGHVIRFRRGETIHTENSYKHTLAGFAELARSVGWRPASVWTDPDRLFSVHLLA